MARPRRTARQRRGAWAEQLATDYLERLGWRILGRNLRVGRAEIDILALEPGDAPSVVIVEVRGLHFSAYGAPEERVDRGKVRVLYRAAAALRALDQLGDERLPAGRLRVDLIVIDARGGSVEVRHLRGLEPP